TANNQPIWGAPKASRKFFTLASHGSQAQAHRAEGWLLPLTPQSSHVCLAFSRLSIPQPEPPLKR
ncbi:MAG: hypothetical protein ACK57H_02930, partial [Hyphomonadaceae bacterium]